MSFVGEDFDAMRSIVGDEDLLFVVATHSIGKFQIFRAGEFIPHVAIDIEDEHAHHLALHDDDMTHIVHTDA